ncbi:MAG: peroxiredoxin [Acidobacteria bacterium]|nr:peroxiredoxin [Acidobacteriota bacterium]
MLSWFSGLLPVGSEAPGFILPDQEGAVFVLNLNRNKNVVLVFYPGDNTPVCTAQLCEIRDDWGKLQAAGVTVLGINPGAAEKHKGFRAKHSLPFPLLVDNGKRVAKLYHCDGPIVRRTVYVIGKGGKIAFAKRGKPPVSEILGAIS